MEPCLELDAQVFILTHAVELKYCFLQNSSASVVLINDPSLERISFFFEHFLLGLNCFW